MPSIQQVIAEIQLASDLPPSHIAKAVQIIRDAEQRLKLKSVTRPRKITNAKNLVTLDVWEGERPDRAWLAAANKWRKWQERHDFCPQMLAEMLDEFRREMRAKGKEYADFAMAFQTYLRKGYLSKTIDACTRARSPYKIKTTVDKRGVTL